MKNIGKAKRVFVALGLILVPLTNWAGEASLSGYGEVEVAPEFVSLNVRVTSECYRSAIEASQANDTVANKVLEVIKSVAVQGQGDEVKATGGYVHRYTGYDPRTEKNICVNTFKKINQISLKTRSVDQFPQLFAELQDKLYALGMEMNPNNTEQPLSYLEIGEPMAALSVETQRAQERRALALALQDAKEKFQSTLVLAGIDKYKIVNYSDSGLSPRPIGDESRKALSRASGEAAPVEFGLLTIGKSIYVRFEYTGGELNIPFAPLKAPTFR